jgi:hypothetical protein
MTQDQTEFDRAARLHIYYHFAATGHPPTPRETASTLKAPLADIEASYRRLAAGRVIVFEPGTFEIRMANPLSAIPTQHRVETIGRAWYGNCVWDALGVIAMFGGTGTVTTECGDCGEPMRLTVRDHELIESQGVIHYAVPAAHWWDDIIYT